MARGWESKSVEEQMSAAGERAEARQQQKRSAEAVERERKRDGLMLQRKRVTGEIERCCDERYRKTLSDGLAYLDEQLALLSEPATPSDNP